MTAAAQRRADELIASLGLEVLEGESGWWRLLRESGVFVTTTGGAVLPASNTIHFVLSPDRPVNIWHLLESDDVHVLVEGGPVEYVLLPASGPASGPAPGPGSGPASGPARRHLLTAASPVVILPAGDWTGVRLADPQGYAWIVSTVTPAWTPQRARIGLDPDARERWIGAEPWLTASLLDALGDASGA